MKEISQIVQEAQKALELMQNGKTYPSFYVLDRLEKAANDNSSDQLIGHMRDILKKRSSSQDMFTQTEIAVVYDELVNFAGKQTAFKRVLGDLLPEGYGVVSTQKKDYSSMRVNAEQTLEPIYKDSDLSKSFESIFDLNKEASFYHKGMDRQAEKFASLQLKSISMEPSKIKAIQGNQHYILCVASYDTSDFTQVNVAIPVKVSSGAAELPTHMVQDGGLVELNKTNMLVHLKDSKNQKTKELRNKFALGRRQDMISTDTPVVPKSLEPYADIETQLIVAASKHSADQVQFANSIVTMELAKMGIRDAQVKVHIADDKSVTFRADVPTSAGYTPIYVPVEMHNGSPILPSKFASDLNADSSGVYEFDYKGMNDFVSQVQPDASQGLVSRQAPAMNEMSYHELMDKVIEGAHTKQYRLAEDALNTINQRFGSTKYLDSLDKYSKMLKHSSVGSDRNKMVKSALESGDFVMLPTSVEPYCPKLGLPASKVTFDDKGRPVPMRRNAQTDNLGESSAHMVTSKIVLT